MNSNPTTWRKRLILFVAAIAIAPVSQSFTPNSSTMRAKYVITKLYISETDEDINNNKLKGSLLSNAKTLSLTPESYAPSRWSNRFGTVLTPASHPSVYTADRPFYWNKIDVGGRMTVIQLSATSVDPTDGREKPQLWVHSPVDLEDSLRDTLKQLGVVTHVVSPNYEHVKYAKQWGEAYPSAYMWGCPGMMEKEPQVRWTGELPFGVRPYEFPNAKIMDGEWDERLWDSKEIQPCHFDTELNPFTNKAFFNEVVFYHTPSQTLLTTDIYWNYPAKDGITNSDLKSLTQQEGLDFGGWELAPNVPSIPFGSSLWKVGMDKIYLPFYLKLMVRKDEEEFQTLASYISGITGWEVETLIPCHGDIVRGKRLIRDVLKRHFKLPSAS